MPPCPPIRHRRAARGPLLMALALLAGGSLAQTRPAPVVYPARGQDAEQQDRDRYACHDWARTQSGVDPTRLAAAVPAAPAAPTATTAPAADPTGGMGRGAIGGAAIAEVTNHDSGRGAAVGALASGLAGRIKQSRQAPPAASAPPATPSAAVQAQDLYQRAFAACLEARGYVVR